jgi:hypothetical protein
MHRAKVLAATEAIRELLHKFPFSRLPNPTARQEAEEQLDIIRENAPESCGGKIVSLSKWLDILFVPEKHTNYLQPDLPNVLRRVRAVQRNVLSDLSWIDAVLKKIVGGPQIQASRDGRATKVTTNEESL